VGASDGTNPVAVLAIDTKGNVTERPRSAALASASFLNSTLGRSGWTETVLHTFGGAGFSFKTKAAIAALKRHQIMTFTRRAG
jgi:hypothetical protein